jgi:hypothetical protein
MSIAENAKIEFEFSVRLNGPDADNSKEDTYENKKIVKAHLNEIYNWYEFIAMYHEMSVKTTYVEKTNRFSGIYRVAKKSTTKIIADLLKYVHADRSGMYPIIIDDAPYVIVGSLVSVTEDL